MSEAALAVVPSKRVSLVEKFAAKYSIEAGKLLDTLKQTAFKVKEGDPPVTNEQMAALLIVSDQYGLNPFVKEIFAFPDKNGGIVPVVGVDGWSRIINEHPQFDGMDFNFQDQTDALPAWIECVMHRKDRSHPIVVREYMTECKRGSMPWNSHPRRMLRHKSVIQAGRLAFGFVGIYDEDEAERIIGSGVAIEGTVATERAAQTATDRVKSNLRKQETPGNTFDNQPEPKAAAPESALPVQEVPVAPAVVASPAAAQESVSLTTACKVVSAADSENALKAYCESLPEEVKINAKFQKAVKKRLDELKTPSDGPKVTYALIADKIAMATDIDVLDAHADMIQYIESAGQQDELRDLYKARRDQLLNPK